MFIATPEDKHTSYWTKDNPSSLVRVRNLFAVLKFHEFLPGSVYRMLSRCSFGRGFFRFYTVLPCWLRNRMQSLKINCSIREVWLMTWRYFYDDEEKSRSRRDSKVPNSECWTIWRTVVEFFVCFSSSSWYSVHLWKTMMWLSFFTKDSMPDVTKLLTRRSAVAINWNLLQSWCCQSSILTQLNIISKSWR